ncbi:hypothetical protein BDZ89DRAFT_1067826 [Hymenopellis radicata]|nr:hypothetical protein BDZ89DRAFT_1067826 [Hymenopellis radicata]
MMGDTFLAGLLNSTALYQPIPCLDRSSMSTLVQLAQCFNNYTVPSDYYTLESYTQAQPNESQLQDWSQLVTAILDVGKPATVPASLQDFFTVSSFTDASDGAEYCILSETYANSDNYYVKGWGLFLVPVNASLDIHLASPHPMFDFDTPDQAVTLFQLSGAKSLLISGRHRSAYPVATDCIPSTSRTTYYHTDPTHDVNEPFSVANTAIRAWQEANGGCPSESCAYIQLHGKASTSCSTVDMMVSAGLGSSDAEWYLDDVDRPAKRLRRELQASFPTYNVSLPSDTTCSLTATKNVFARLLNGVAESEVCIEAATADKATGQFVHVEQAYHATLADTFDGWARALVATFSDSVGRCARLDKDAFMRRCNSI